MPVIDTATTNPETLNSNEKQQIYNGLDTALTVEIWQNLQTLFNTPPSIYKFQLSLQGPCLEMMVRGFKIDQYERQKGIKLLHEQQDILQKRLDRMAQVIWDKPLNPRSQKQLLEFFYQSMHLPEIWTRKKGIAKLSMDREVLEKIELYIHARPIVACILGIRELAKKLDVLEAEVDSDGRIRTSINLGGTETGRLSSSVSSTGSGTNLFNITPELRRMFIADSGWKLCAIDLEQAESREVGRICYEQFNDSSYLDACESGDLHTLTACLIWPNLPWTGDLKADRKIADQLFYRHFSYRDMSKRGGHGSNYYGTPWTMAKHLKVPPKLMVDFQEKYFEAFPCIPKWHRWVAEQLQTTQQITTMFGRQRSFFARPGDDETLREAIAYDPQSCTGDRLNIGLLKIWQHFRGRVQLLLQLYDAVYFQYREDDDEDTIIKEALRLIELKQIIKNNRIFTVPGEAKVGWNWASIAENNPDGLMKYKGSDTRTRTTLLNRPL